MFAFLSLLSLDRQTTFEPWRKCGIIGPRMRHEVPEGDSHSGIRSLARYRIVFHSGSTASGPELRRQRRACIARRPIFDSALSLYQFAGLCPLIDLAGWSSAFPQAEGSKTRRNSLKSR